MADIKNFGIKGIANDVQMGKSGGRLKYDSANNRFDLTQSDGSTLEDIRVGSVTAGAWTGTSIGAAYGGTGADLSASTGTIQVSSGTVTAGAIDISDSNFVTGALAVANGGTGATDAATARTNLGLGNLSVQADNAVDINGGAIDGTIIGASTAANITGTTITANTAFVGDLTGTADDADALSSAVTVAISGDATGTATFTSAGDTATIATTLATVYSDNASVGSTTAIPVLTIDAKGRVTAATTAAIATSWTLSDGSTTQVIDGGDTLTVAGTANEVDVAVSATDTLTIGLPANVTISNNLSVTGSFLSDDITAASVNINGDATITGDLTVQGTTTTLNSTVVEIADDIFRVNSAGGNNDAGFEAYVNNVAKAIMYDTSESEWTFGSENVKATSFEGDLTGDVTGTVSSIANHDTGDLSEGSNLYYTDARVATKIDSYVTGGTGITVTSGSIVLDNTAATAGSYGSSTAIPVLTVDAQGRITAASTASISTSFTLAGDTGSSTIDGGDTLTVTGGTNVTSVVSGDAVTLNLDSALTGLTSIGTGALTATGTVEGATLTDGTASLASGSLTSAVNGTFSGNLQGGTVTDGTLSISSGSITSGVAGTFSGAVEGGSLTDGTATLSSGALSGATTGAFSGNVSSANYSATGEVSAVTGDFSGQLDFGSLSDGAITVTGFVDEDNMVSDSATLVPTQQSVKAYVDAQSHDPSLDFTADSGGALSIDLDSETLTIAGGTGISSVGSGNGVTLNLDTTLTGLTSITSTDFVGALTGDVTGTADLATALVTGQTISATGDVAFTTGAFNGTGAVTGAATLATVNTDVGSVGSTTTIPVLTIDAKGRVTAATTAAIATSFTLSDGSNTQTVAGGDTLTVAGTTNEVDVAVSATDTLTIGLPSNVTVANNLSVGNNLSITGSFLSDDITASTVTVNGDAVITGDLTVQGTTTTINSTVVEVADDYFRVNSAGGNNNAGFEAYVNNVAKSITYSATDSEWQFGSENVKATSFEGSLTGNADTATALAAGQTIGMTGDVAWTSASFDGTGAVTGTSTLATVYSDNASVGSTTAIPVLTIDAKGRITAATTAAIATAVTIAGDTGGNQVVDNGDAMVFAGGTNISTVTSATDTITINLDSAVSGLTSVSATTVTDGVASLNSGSLTGAVGVTASGAIQFGSLTDGTTAITDFETTITDSDVKLPTSGAVVDYVAGIADGMLIRSSFTADSTANSFNIGTVPNVATRTYYAAKVVIKVGTAFSGDSVNAIKITENGTGGSVLVAVDDADCTTLGTYNVELDGDLLLTKNAAVTVSFVKVDGSSAAVPTAGALTASVQYNYV